MQMCLPSFVSPSCMVLLLWCFLLNMTAMCYNINRWAYFWALNVPHLCSKNGGGHVLRVGILSRDYGMFVCVIALEFMPIYKSAPLDRSNCCCWKCVVSFKLESTECGHNLLYVNWSWSTHGNLLFFFLLQIIDGRLPTGSTKFDSNSGWEQSGHA